MIEILVENNIIKNIKSSNDHGLNDILGQKFNNIFKKSEKPSHPEDVLSTNVNGHLSYYLIASHSKTENEILYVLSSIDHLVHHFDSILLAKEKELDSIIDMIPGILYWKDKNGNYLKTNKSVLSSGISFDSVVGKNDVDIWPDKAKELKTHDRKVMETKQTLITEESTIEKGEIHYYIAQKRPYFDQNNEVIGVIGLSIDITERKKLQEETIRQKNQLEKKLQFQHNYLKSAG